MLRFILRRLALIPPALLLINFLGYAYANLVLPLRAARTPYLMSMPKPGPLLPSYFDYLGRAIRFDFGTISSGAGQTESSVAEVLGQAIPASLGLLVIALAISVGLGLTLGVVAARTDPPHQARWMPVASTVGLAMPSFYIGSLFLLAVFALVLNSGGALLLPLQGFGWDEHLVLPVLALLVRPTVQIGQMTSGLLVDELGKLYVVSARSFGNSWGIVRWRHALRNVLAALVLAIAGSFRLLVGELILVEWLFKWPGLGYLFAQTLIPPLLSTGMRSPVFLNPTVVATVLTILAALFLLTDLIASVVVRAIDPRLRVEGEEVAGAAA
jgi:peptide/nickel transport system permease protein